MHTGQKKRARGCHPVVPEELARVKPQATIETSWTCRECGAARLVPAHLVVALQREDPWSALRDLLFGSCGNCGQQVTAAYATVLVEADATEGRLGYLLLPVRGTPSVTDIEDGRRLLGEHQVPPVLVAGLVPSGGPPADPAPP